MSTSTSDSSTSTATSSSEEAAPGPSKRPRVSKKVKKAAKKAKPSKVLAKNAKKKNDKKCRRSILKHVKEAQKITSEKVGPKMEKECQRVEKNLDSWKKDGVEVDALQRYVGRIMKKVKELNVIVSCDHAVFLREAGLISLLEMDLVGTLDDTGPITPQLARMKANSLLELVIDSDSRNRIQQTWDGMAWKFRSETDVRSNGKCI